MNSGMALKKREFTPESGNVDTYGCCNGCEAYVTERLRYVLPLEDNAENKITY